MSLSFALQTGSYLKEYIKEVWELYQLQFKSYG